MPTLEIATEPTVDVLGPFKNEEYLDFSAPENRSKMLQALSKVRGELGREYELVIGEKKMRTQDKIMSVNPARPAEVIGIHQRAEAEHAQAAMQVALTAFESWKKVPSAERANLLLRLAKLSRKLRFELNAWLILEVGKNWAEAEAETAEMIDFMEFYAREALRLDEATTPIQFPGEKNQLRYVPLGVGAVISPWNYPFAIMAGMTCAALVCGNTVILKPSPDAPTIATKFMELLAESGAPKGVVTLCNSEGPGFGSAVVTHPQTRFIAFTGSKAVGLQIHKSAAATQKGQQFIRRTILELGGKDCVVVAADCDLDGAVEGVALSAFGFNGQKCSAGSRAIVDASIYDAFLQRLADRVAQIKVGDPATNFFAGPVINERAYQRVLDYIEIGKKEGRFVTGGHAIETKDRGYYIAPTIFADVSPMARIAQEEIFGPVLTVIRARDYDDALAIANGTEYGLTGAVYSSSQEKLDQAREEFHVGNLYFNRKCTGAMVGAHPFGGFNMSGTDSKAGGPDYLLHFTQAKSIAQKLNLTRSST